MNAFVSHYIHMQASRGDTYEPNGYLDNNRPQEIEMRNYSQSPEPQAVLPQQPPAYN